MDVGRAILLLDTPNSGNHTNSYPLHQFLTPKGRDLAISESLGYDSVVYSSPSYRLSVGPI